jgi:hypothetical protein
MFTAFGIPGSFPNSIRVSTGAGNAFASVTIQQVDLVVFGPRSIILEPRAQHQVESNPFGRDVSYTANGGSFGTGTSNSVYTAPTQAGNYFFTVHYAGQSIRIDVRVPLRISPKSRSMAAGETFQFSVNAAGASWSATSTSGPAGTILQNGFYTAPSSGGTIVTITASGNGDSDTATVSFLTIYPYNPTFATEGETVSRAAVVYTEDGQPKGRLKDIKKTYQLHYDFRDRAEVLAAIAFHEARFPDLPFLYQDHNLNIFVAVRFDSQISWQWSGGGCSGSYSFRIKEA